MIKIYVKKILANQMTIEEVPLRWRSDVEKALEEYNNKEGM